MSLKSFTEAYIEVALWSTNDESDESGGMPLNENYGPSDIAPDTMKQMKKDCSAFYENWHPLWDDEYSDTHAGHDFWLTRNEHGAGFWDGDIKNEKNADRLTDAAKRYGEVNLYVGDDGKIYS